MFVYILAYNFIEGNLFYRRRIVIDKIKYNNVGMKKVFFRAFKFKINSCQTVTFISLISFVHFIYGFYEPSLSWVLCIDL